MSARQILPFEGFEACELLRPAQSRESDFAAVSGGAVGKTAPPSGCVASPQPLLDEVEYWERITERATD